MRSRILQLPRRIFEWSRRHVRLTIALLSALLVAGIVPYLVFAVTFTAPTTVFLNQVGIGTTTPGSALDVNGTLRLEGVTSGYVGLVAASAADGTTYTLPSADWQQRANAQHQWLGGIVLGNAGGRQRWRASFFECYLPMYGQRLQLHRNLSNGL